MTEIVEEVPANRWTFAVNDAKPKQNALNFSVCYPLLQKRVCRVHGGLSRGPVTKEGRVRCGAAKLIHGRETRQIRNERNRGCRVAATCPKKTQNA